MVIYEKATGDITLNGERPKAFPLRSGIRQGCLISPLLFNVVLAVSGRAIDKKKKETASILKRKK